MLENKNFQKMQMLFKAYCFTKYIKESRSSYLIAKSLATQNSHIESRYQKLVFDTASSLLKIHFKEFG